MKIICIGRNFTEHIQELKNQITGNPIIFLKPETSLIIGRLPFFLPDFSQEIHHEIELVIRICKNGKRIEERFAHKYFDAITVGIDFTARDIQNQQKEGGLPWEIAKAFDGSAAIGEFIPLSKQEEEHIKFSLLVNGELRQNGNSSQMIYSFSKIISYVSVYFTLKTGDLIFTGTPAGVRPVKRNDYLEGYIGEKRLLTLKIK
ncbi:MAG: fumarylacetoacetate hydrolase family protein [Bacteroidia bacterium]|nr:fumarylacetoacetate hydrolase family protein [Bacteroidia bacterium]MCZ2277007.1 fumarylacetoacetate hydrolase family protein [Bacteroidia bacterium]